MTIRRTRPINSNDQYISDYQPRRDHATPQILTVLEPAEVAA